MATNPSISDLPTQQRFKFRFSLRSALIATAVAALFFALVHYALELRKSHQRVETRNDFRLIGIGLQVFNDQHQRLPSPVDYYSNKGFYSKIPNCDSGAKPLYSWRFGIIEIIVDYPLWGPENHQPYSYDGSFDNSPNSVLSNTSAFAITGPGTAFGDGKSETPSSIYDIDLDTILVVEVRNSGIHWMKPGDFNIQLMPRSINARDGRGISGEHGLGFHVLFADGTVWHLRNDVPFSELSKFFTIAGAKANDRDTVLIQYKYD